MNRDHHDQSESKSTAPESGHARPDWMKDSFPDLSSYGYTAVTQEVLLHYLSLNTYLSSAMLELQAVGQLTEQAIGTTPLAPMLLPGLAREYARLEQLFNGLESLLHDYHLCTSLRICAQWNVDMRLSTEAVEAVWQESLEKLTNLVGEQPIASAAIPERYSDAQVAINGDDLQQVTIMTPDGSMRVAVNSLDEALDLIMNLGNRAQKPTKPSNPVD